MLESLGVVMFLFPVLILIAGCKAFMRNHLLIWWLIVFTLGPLLIIFDESDILVFITVIVVVGLSIWMCIKWYQTDKKTFYKSLLLAFIMSLLCGLCCFCQTKM